MTNRTRLKLLYVTNRVDVALAAEAAGLDHVFVDLETVGKEARQSGRDTVKSAHTIGDIVRLRAALTKARLLVRINPIGPWSRDEIDAVVTAGADIVMLPYFSTLKEAEDFLGLVQGRARAWLLLETAGAAAIVADLSALAGVEMIFIGLNDLHISQGQDFLFEPLASGQVDELAAAIRAGGKAIGFGGIGRLGGDSLVSADTILGEHVRLGSQGVILARSFIRASDFSQDGGALEDLGRAFHDGIAELRSHEARWQEADAAALQENRCRLVEQVTAVLHSRSRSHG